MSYTTNRLIVLITLCTFIAITILQLAIGTSLLTALGIGIATGVAVFLSWALAREIDPAHDWSAFVPLPITLITALILGPPALLTLFFLLLSSRIINQTTGGQATTFDSILLIILAIFQLETASIIPLIYLFFVLICDTILRPNNPKQGNLAAFTMIITLVVVFMYTDISLTLNISSHEIITAIILIAAVVTLMLTAKERDAYGDSNQLVLSGKRIVIAKVMLALFIIISLLFLGQMSTTMLYPAISSFVGAALYHIVKKIINNKK